jgi:poly(A) polymerase
LTGKGHEQPRPAGVPREVAIEIVRTLRAAEHEAYFAGGCVRDELLGLVPKDYDVATDATPDRIRGMFKRTEAVGAAFGVVLVKQGGCVVEVATFRADGPYSDRRRPDSITFSDARADAARRDFTINALFLDPIVDDGPGSSGVSGDRGFVGERVIDYVGGVADLRAKVVRAVGDPAQRLAEDHLRALRAVRFASRLGFELEAGTASAIRAHARGLEGVSRERIGDEVRAMLGHGSRARSVTSMQALGLDGPALSEPCWDGPMPVLEALEGAMKEPRHWPEPGTGVGEGPSVAVRALACWGVDRCGGDLSKAIQRRDGWRKALCLSVEEERGFEGLLEVAGQMAAGVEAWGVAKRKRLGASLMSRGAWEVLVGHEPTKAQAWADDLHRLAREPGGLAPEPWVDGTDLIAAGWVPGPRFKAALEALYDAQLEGRASSRAEALELVRGLGVQRSGTT